MKRYMNRRKTERHVPSRREPHVRASRGFSHLKCYFETLRARAECTKRCRRQSCTSTYGRRDRESKKVVSLTVECCYPLEKKNSLHLHRHTHTSVRGIWRGRIVPTAREGRELRVSRFAFDFRAVRALLTTSSGGKR